MLLIFDSSLFYSLYKQKLIFICALTWKTGSFICVNFSVLLSCSLEQEMPEYWTRSKTCSFHCIAYWRTRLMLPLFQSSAWRFPEIKTCNFAVTFISCLLVFPTYWELMNCFISSLELLSPWGRFSINLILKLVPALIIHSMREMERGAALLY